MAHVQIPRSLAGLADGKTHLFTSAPTLKRAIEELRSQHPTLAARLCDGEGNLRHFVGVFRNGDDVRHLEGLDTPLSPEDNLSIVVAFAGG